MKTVVILSMVLGLTLFTTSCKKHQTATVPTPDSAMMKLNDFASFKLTTDLSVLSENEKKMIPLLIDAAKIMDDIFWIEAYGDKQALLDSLKTDAEKQLVMINYGPWERLNNNKPFIAGKGTKPLGANFYPVNMTEKEFSKLDSIDKTAKGLYTLIRRDEQGKLIVVPYHTAFAAQVKKVSDLLMAASKYADDPGLKKYLELRSGAFLDDDYYMSDLAWMDMKDNVLDFVVGPIESYEDQLNGYKASHEAYILVKDIEWSRKLNHYSALLPTLQKGLPVDAKYKTEMPGGNSDLGAYDVIYYAGDCNAGSKTIAINLPNDDRVNKAKGSRRLQLKNAMQAKFDKILIPIATELIPADQLQHVTFDAFFSNVMFHEVAHGLGCMKTINGKGSVQAALKEQYTTLEEGKADILGLYLEASLKEMGELDVDLNNEYTTFLAGIFRSIRFGASSAHGKGSVQEALKEQYTTLEEGKADILGLYLEARLKEMGELDVDLSNEYTTFLAGIFRSIRFGASSAHGKANLVRFNYFKEKGAFAVDSTGKYHVDMDKMKDAIASLSNIILTIQGDGDYDKAGMMLQQYGNMDEDLKSALKRIEEKDIPVDIVFEQGKEVLGL